MLTKKRPGDFAAVADQNVPTVEFNAKTGSARVFVKSPMTKETWVNGVYLKNETGAVVGFQVSPMAVPRRSYNKLLVDDYPPYLTPSRGLTLAGPFGSSSTRRRSGSPRR